MNLKSESMCSMQPDKNSIPCFVSLQINNMCQFYILFVCNHPGVSYSLEFLFLGYKHPIMSDLNVLSRLATVELSPMGEKRGLGNVSDASRRKQLRHYGGVGHRISIGREAMDADSSRQ